MKRWLYLPLWALILGYQPAMAQRPMPSNSTPSAAEVIAEENKKAATPRAVAIDGVPRIAQITWYGHAFIYLVTPTGVRVAIDPFENENLEYAFPRNLAADVVLTSNERPDHAAATRLSGNPQVFRSYTAVGSNRANGMTFKGVEVPSEPRKDFDVSKCTAFVFEVDGVRYVHLGTLGDRINSPEARLIGKADVIFVPVGNKDLSVSDVNRVVKLLEPKVIVPIKYKTDLSGGFDLKPLEKFLEETDYPVKEISENTFNLRPDMLPSEPTVYVLNLS